MKMTIHNLRLGLFLSLCGSAWASDPAPNASLAGNWTLKSSIVGKPGKAGPVYMTGAGQIVLQDLPGGDYRFRLEESGDRQEFSILLPGGFKKAILPREQTEPSVDEFEFRTTHPTEMIILGERSIQASWKSLEIEGKDGRFKSKFAASDYPREPLPAPFIPSPGRIAEIAAMLPEQPATMGPNIGDRAAWEAFARRNPGNHFVEHADEAMKTPVPVLTDELYMVYKTKGTRKDYEVPFQNRRRRLLDMTIAECLTNQGRYLPGIERELEAILGEKTWILPANDLDLQNLTGKIHNVDLEVAVRGLSVATTYSWLGDKLPEPLRQKIREALQVRVLDPYLQRLRNKDPKLCWWITTSSNWNAVCSAGVVGTALAVLPARADRAEFVAGAEAYLPFYLSGLGQDGYGEEGLGYWNYGFGHYVFLAETLLHDTGGRMNLYDRDAARKTTTFPSRIELQPGVYPSFGDCPLDVKPFTWLRNLSSRRILGHEADDLTPAEKADNPIGGTIYEISVAGFPLDPPEPAATPKADGAGPALRDWFPQEGVVICRPSDTSRRVFSAAFKGGRDFGSHRHFDLGEFLVALDGEMPLVDPGLEIYTAKPRETIEMVTSFGHSVPILAGRGQRWAADAEAKVVKTQFTEDSDEMALDLTSAYPVPALQKLTRTFLYKRTEGGSVTVTDDVAFTSPETYEGQLITYGKVTLLGDRSVQISVNNKNLHLDIDSDVPFHLAVEPVKTINKIAPTRLKIILQKPVTQAQVIYQIKPE